jgi:hypothetical protein
MPTFFGPEFWPIWRYQGFLHPAGLRICFLSNCRVGDARFADSSSSKRSLPRIGRSGVLTLVSEISIGGKALQPAARSGHLAERLRLPMALSNAALRVKSCIGLGAGRDPMG